MKGTADSPAARLAQALASASGPIVPLLEYKDEFERHLNDSNDINLVCLAALLRVQAQTVRREILGHLEAIEDAARNLVIAS